VTSEDLTAILVVVVLIARELYLQRRQKEQPSNAGRPAEQDKYRPRIFTFERSIWFGRDRPFDLFIKNTSAVGFLLGLFVWGLFKPLVLRVFHLTAEQYNTLPRWMSLSGMLVCALVFCCLFMIVGICLARVLEAYDERVFKRVFSPEERDNLDAMAYIAGSSSGKVEENLRRHGEYLEEVERIYRGKGL
jgi:hypothetical protein